MATLKDVAQKANVSTATVSNCLSGARNVTPKTRLKVMQAIEELNYVPNAAARDLRSTRSNKIGLVLPDLIDPYYNGIQRGVLNRIHTEDYILSIAFSNRNSREECQKIDELINSNVAGLLIATCQPDNSVYFRNRIQKLGIPTVFIHEKPKIDLNYVGFESYPVMKQFASLLLQKGYRDIDIIMGSKDFFTEQEALRGVRDAFLEAGLSFPVQNIYTSDMTKEHAFCSAMRACQNRVPEAILSTSSQMTLGIKEALDLCGIKVPQDTFLATLGVESWNATNHLDGVVYSRRSADSLGAGAADLLLKTIQSGGRKKPVSLFYHDNFHFDTLVIPPLREHEPVNTAAWNEIRVMAFDSPSVHALEMLSKCYGKQHHLRFRFDYLPLCRIIPEIIAAGNASVPDYDIAFFDAPWIGFLGDGNIFEDLAPLMENQRLGQLNFPEVFLENCIYDRKILGLPIICGTQVMFYRKDLFGKPSVMRAYKDRFDATLRPPRSWHEYNQVASFFTRSCNPDSPTEYGTAIPCLPTEYMIPELMIRIWGSGAKLWNSSGHPTLNSNHVEQAYQNLLDAFAYVPGNPLATDAAGTIGYFSSGEAAMMIAFTDYAGEIRNSLNERIISDIGYAPIPGHATLRAGRNLGIFPNAQNKEAIYDYLRWVFSSDTSSYYTILGGQTCVQEPYDNSEIISQYPWMALTLQPAENYMSRGVPKWHNFKKRVPINEFESILCNVLTRVTDTGISLHSSLQIGQKELEALFASCRK